MLLVKLNYLAIMMLQGEVGFDLRSMWAQMGFAAKAVCHSAGHHVRMVDRRHDRSLHRVQPGPQTVA